MVEFKDSGIQWLGKIPQHWEFDRIKDVSQLRDEKVQIHSEGKNYLELEDIEKGTGKVISFRDTMKVASSVMRFKQGDVLFGKLRPYLAKYYYALESGYCTGEILAIEPLRLHGKFLKYFIGSPNFIKRCDISAYGAKMPRVNWNTQIGTFEIPLPPLTEQKAIADYLDRATKKIDRVIAIKQKQLERIEGYFFSRLNEVMTCSDSKFDEDVFYEGFINRKISEDWKVDRLRDVVIINDKALGSSTAEDYLMHYLDISNVNKYGIIDSNDILQLTFEEAPSRARRISKRFDTVISSVRTNLQAVAFLDLEVKNLICSTGFFVCRPKFPALIKPKYLYYFLLSAYSKDFFFSFSTGVSYPAINDYKFGSIDIFYPSPTVQDQIIDKMETLRLRVNETINNINSQITTLQSYRQSLIHECVTGKKRVVEVDKTENILEKTH